MSLWTSNDLALAVDPTTLSDRHCAIVVSVVYRGCAIPVAWDVMPANKPGMRVIVMTDRGLRSPNLWKKIRELGWNPYMRQSINTVFRIDGGMRTPARRPVSDPGSSFIGR